MSKFVIYALPLLLLLLAIFGFAVDVFDLEPQRGAVVKLVLFGAEQLPPHVVLATWLLEAAGLLALFLLAQGRCGFWWLDGLVAGWVAWIFRGPLLVITIVTATGQVQQRWWKIALAWWVLYSICGLALAILARRSWLLPASRQGLAIASTPSEPSSRSEPLTPKTRSRALASEPLDRLEVDLEREEVDRRGWQSEEELGASSISKEKDSGH